MAGIDYTIPGQIKGIQLESPMNAMAQAMQLRNLQETSQMNALKAQEYQRGLEQKNNLARIYADKSLKPGSPEQLTRIQQEAPDLFEGVATRAAQQAKLAEEIEGRKYQNFDRKFKLYQSVTPNIRTIDDVSKFISASYADPDLSPILNQIRPYADALNANLDAFNEDPENWRLQAAGVSPKEIAEIARNKAKEERDANKPMVVAPGGQLVSPKGEVLFAAPDREKESDLARLQRERAAIAAENPNDPRLAQYDAAIAKTTATNQPLSDLARKQNELAVLEEQLKADPNNKLLQQRIKEYKDDIRKDTTRPVTNVNVAPPVQTVTVQGPNGPEMRDARTGRLITDDKGQALKPYDASTKPLTPVQQQKLVKERTADSAKVTAATDLANDIQKNATALIGSEDGKIKPHPGLPGITGYNAMLPSLPNSQARGAQQLLDNIKGKVTMMGKSLASQEGKLGNMAVQEWKIVSDAVERLDPAAPNFASQLRSVTAQARRLETNLKARHAEMYPAAPADAPSPPTGFVPDRK